MVQVPAASGLGAGACSCGANHVNGEYEHVKSEIVTEKEGGSWDLKLGREDLDGCIEMIGWAEGACEVGIRESGL